MVFVKDVSPAIADKQPSLIIKNKDPPIPAEEVDVFGLFFPFLYLLGFQIR